MSKLIVLYFLCSETSGASMSCRQMSVGKCHCRLEWKKRGISFGPKEEKKIIPRLKNFCVYTLKKVCVWFIFQLFVILCFFLVPFFSWPNLSPRIRLSEPHKYTLGSEERDPDLCLPAEKNEKLFRLKSLICAREHTHRFMNPHCHRIWLLFLINLDLIYICWSFVSCW